MRGTQWTCVEESLWYCSPNVGQVSVCECTPVCLHVNGGTKERCWPNSCFLWTLVDLVVECLHSVRGYHITLVLHMWLTAECVLYSGITNMPAHYSYGLLYHYGTSDIMYIVT